MSVEVIIDNARNIQENGSRKCASITPSWLYLLPQDHAAEMIIISGSPNINRFRGLSCKSLTWVVINDSPGHADNGMWLRSTEALESERFDIGLIEDPTYLRQISRTGEIGHIFNEMRRVLKTSGVLLIGLPNGYLKNKSQMFKLLSQSGFSAVQTFLCDPSFAVATTVYPLSFNKEFTYQLLYENCLSKTGMTRLKGLIKYFAASRFQSVNPFMGSFVLARKGHYRYAEGPGLPDEHSGPCADVLAEPNCSYAVWLSKPPGDKLISLLYCGDSVEQRLIAVEKTAFPTSPRATAIRREYKNLQLLDSLRSIPWDGDFPKPMKLVKTHSRISSLETAVHGRQLAEIFRNQLTESRFVDMRVILDTIFRVLGDMQVALTKHLLGEVLTADHDYFENALDIPLGWFQNTERLEIFGKSVQHGDFTAENVLYDHESGTVGLVDWEWLSSGYPHLYDVYHFVSSLEFHRRQRMKSNLFEHYYESFIETYFKRSFLSEYISGVIDEYCRRFDYDRALTYEFFMDFLLFQYNKYRITYNNGELRRLYEALLHFGAANKCRFALHEKT